MLKVSAREVATGLAKHITIDNALARYETEEREAAEARLAGLWQSDATDLEPVAVASGGPSDHHREIVQARALLEKAQRLAERLQPADREDIHRQGKELEHALTQQDWQRLQQASDRLSDSLFYLEEA
jgi:molecular chaperone DnaK